MVRVVRPVPTAMQSTHSRPQRTRTRVPTVNDLRVRISTQRWLNAAHHSTYRSSYASYAAKKNDMMMVRHVSLTLLCPPAEPDSRSLEPEDPPRAWTHPCTCTLVAHETCLLQWIKAAQDDPARAPNALKCPQCGASYELESDNPHPKLLRILDTAYGALSIAGKVFVFGGVATVVVSFGFGTSLPP